MRNTVVFENEGVIDIRSMKTFGISVKEGTNPIGYFGTGLKYAISIFIRTGHKVTVEAGGERFEFGKKEISVRGKSFEFITINGEELSYTTELGKNWEVWQAFREVYCNTIDENGTTNLVSNLDPIHTDMNNKTRVTITGADIVSCYHNRDSIVLREPSSLLVFEGKTEIYNKQNQFLYYRGIRVFKLDRTSLLTHNILDESTLTEDRTLHNVANAIRKIAESILQLTDKVLIKEIITNESCFEYSLDFDGAGHWTEPSKEFEEVIEREYQANNELLSASARCWLRSRKNRQSFKHYEPVKMSPIEERQLSRVIEIAKKTFNDFEEYDLLVVKHLGESTMALAEVDQQRIILSRKCFDKGTKYLLSTYIEEFMHIKTGFSDCTRQLQTHLFDSLCTLIEEHVIEEPV